MRYDTRLYTEHLSRMVRFPTISRLNADEMDIEAYTGLIDYLDEAYPLIRRNLNREPAGRAGLIYTWRATGKSDRLPLLLIAHSDVVPPGDPAMWTYPPFGGDIAGGFVWGRGTLDCKCYIEMYLDAIELLLQEGYRPDCDVYLAFGYNEEIMGGPEPAAALLAGTFEKRGVRFGCVLDEGGCLSRLPDGRFAVSIMVGEKGYADYEFSVEDKGGHSSKPGRHTALGMLAKAACLIEDNPFPQRLTGVVAEQLRCMAPAMTDGALFAAPEENWDVLKHNMEQDCGLNALTRTTAALTMAKGSDQANVLPQRAVMVANNRLLPGDTLSDLYAHYRRILPDTVGIRLLKGHNPPPVQRTDTDAYEVLKNVYSGLYPGVFFLPSLACCGTDSRYYCDVCPTGSVYRVAGMCVDVNLWAAIHGANEKIPAEALREGVAFYRGVILEYTKAR